MFFGGLTDYKTTVICTNFASNRQIVFARAFSAREVGVVSFDERGAQTGRVRESLRLTRSLSDIPRNWALVWKSNGFSKWVFKVKGGSLVRAFH